MKGGRNLLILDRRDDLADRLVWVAVIVAETKPTAAFGSNKPFAANELENDYPSHPAKKESLLAGPFFAGSPYASGSDAGIRHNPGTSSPGLL
jgi:hypothetical protein